MSGCAIFMLRETAGAGALAKGLVERFGMRVLANALAAEALRREGVDAEAREEAELASLVAGQDPKLDLRLLVANYREVGGVSRDFLSWKKALGSLDRAVVDAVRQAAWAVERLGVVGDPALYERALEELERGKGTLGQAFRVEQAKAALRAVSAYDFAVAEFLELQAGERPDLGALSGFPEAIRFMWRRRALLDSGENRYQKAAIYGGLGDCLEQLCGPALSFEGTLDLSMVAFLIGEFERPTGLVLKRGHLLAAVTGDDRDRVAAALSAGGSRGTTLAVNWGCDGSLEALMEQVGADRALAPTVTEPLSLQAGRSVFVSKEGLGYEALLEARSVMGGALVQDRNRSVVNPFSWTVQSLAQPRVECWEDLVFGVRLAKHLRSSCAVAVRSGRVLAAASGRLDQGAAWREVAERAGDLRDAVVVFDEALAEPGLLAEMKLSGVRTVAHPGVGANEAAVVEAANECGLALVATGQPLTRLV